MPTLPGWRGSSGCGALVSVSWIVISRGTGAEASRLKVGGSARRFGDMHKCALLFALTGSLLLASTASANPITMPTLARAVQQARAVNPPPPPCPQYGALSCTPVPEAFATTLPFPGNMAYYGGHVQTSPKIYLVYWGWGQAGAWPSGTNCTPTTITGGDNSDTLACDPDGAGGYMADFVDQMGGTDWAGVQTQYFMTDANGNQTFITTPADQLAGIWVDDSNPNTLPQTS